MSKRKTNPFLQNIPQELDLEIKKATKLTGLKKTGFINMAIFNEVNRQKERRKGRII